MEFIYFLIGLIASVFGSLAGLGGGVIIKPSLDLIGEYEVTATSILSAFTVFSMSLVSLMTSLRNRIKIHFKTSLYIAIGSIIGGVIGKFIFNQAVSNVSNLDLITIFQASCLFIFLTMIYFLVKHRSRFPEYRLKNPIMIVLIGFSLGLVAAFLGIGGGPFNVAILTLLFSMGVREAALNSIFIILFSQISSITFSGFTTGFSHVDFKVLAFMICGGILGGFIGGRISRNLSDRTVEMIFNVGIVVILAINLFNIVKFIV